MWKSEYISQLCVWLEINLNFNFFWKRTSGIKSTELTAQIRLLTGSTDSSGTLLSQEWTLCHKIRNCKFRVKCILNVPSTQRTCGLCWTNFKSLSMVFKESTLWLLWWGRDAAFPEGDSVWAVLWKIQKALSFFTLLPTETS